MPIFDQDEPTISVDLTEVELERILSHLPSEGGLHDPLRRKLWLRQGDLVKHSSKEVTESH